MRNFKYGFRVFGGRSAVIIEFDGKFCISTMMIDVTM